MFHFSYLIYYLAILCCITFIQLGWFFSGHPPHWGALRLLISSKLLLGTHKVRYSHVTASGQWTLSRQKWRIPPLGRSISEPIHYSNLLLVLPLRPIIFQMVATLLSWIPSEDELQQRPHTNMWWMLAQREHIPYCFMWLRFGGCLLHNLDHPTILTDTLVMLVHASKPFYYIHARSLFLPYKYILIPIFNIFIKSGKSLYSSRWTTISWEKSIYYLNLSKKKSYKKKVHLKNRPNIFTSSAYKKFN